MKRKEEGSGESEYLDMNCRNVFISYSGRGPSLNNVPKERAPGASDEDICDDRLPAWRLLVSGIMALDSAIQKHFDGR